jgi:hypothetical protein
MAKKIRQEMLTEQEKLVQADYEWARQDPAVRNNYAGQVIAVCGRKVIAAGKSLAELKTILERQQDFSPSRTVIVPIGV